MDSLRQGAEGTTLAINRGIQRCIVEILLPEFWDPMSGAVFAEEGDQMRFWTLGRRFCDDLIQMTNSKDVTLVCAHPTISACPGPHALFPTSPSAPYTVSQQRTHHQPSGRTDP